MRNNNTKSGLETKLMDNRNWMNYKTLQGSKHDFQKQILFFSCLFCPGYRRRCWHIWDCALLLQWRARPVRYSNTHTCILSPHNHKSFIYLATCERLYCSVSARDSWATMMSGTSLYACYLQATCTEWHTQKNTDSHNPFVYPLSSSQKEHNYCGFLLFCFSFTHIMHIFHTYLFRLFCHFVRIVLFSAYCCEHEINM